MIQRKDSNKKFIHINNEIKLKLAIIINTEKIDPK